MDEDKIINKLLEHDDKLDSINQNMSTKDDVRQIVGSLEGIATITKRI